MKKICLTVLKIFFVVTNCFSQDTILKRSNEFILAKVLAVTPTEIKYKKYDNQSGSTFAIRKFDVFCIHYENGIIDSFDFVTPNEMVTTGSSSSSDSFNQGQMNASRNNKRYKGARKGTVLEKDTKDSFNYVDSNTSITTQTPSNSDLLIQGQIDASRYYEGYKGAGAGILITSLASPIVGLIPAIICSSTQPKNINLNYPDSNLIKKPAYNYGYIEKAKKIKQGKVWTNWSIAFAINLVSNIIILASLE